MGEEFETAEIEYSDDDVLYYLYNEDDEEIGIVLEEDGKEVEYYYEWVDSAAYQDLDATDEAPVEAGEEEGAKADPGDGGEEEPEAEVNWSDLDGEVVEMEIDLDAIDHYIFDEKGNEIGFVIIEDGVEVECYYQEEDDSDDFELVDEGHDALPFDSGAETPEDPTEHGYLYKMAQIVGHEGNKARKRAGEQIGKARDAATPAIDKARSKAEAGIDKATEVVESGGKKLKEKTDEYDLGITREGVAEATADLNAIAKEGAETAKELKEAYDDIMDSFDFLIPKRIRRKMP